MEERKDTISRQAAIEAAVEAVDEWDGGYNLERAGRISKAMMAVPQVETDESKKLRILADALDGVPCFLPCQKLFMPEGWCKEHCHTDEPTAECWLKYAEVMVHG